MIWFQPASKSSQQKSQINTAATNPSSFMATEVMIPLKPDHKESPGCDQLLLKNQSSSSSSSTSMLEGEVKKVDAVEETRSNMKVYIRFKSDDKLVSNNKSATTADDLVAASSSEKQMVQHVATVEETRSGKKICIKGDDKLVFNNKSTADDFVIVASSSNKEEKGKQVKKQEITTVEETRSKTKICGKGDDNELVSNNNSTTTDDSVAASSNEEEKEKQVETDSSKPWNLRPRGNSQRVLNDKSENPVLGTQDSGDEKKKNKNKDENKDNVDKQPAKKRKVYISLTRQEIEEDFFKMTGSKLASRHRASNKRSTEEKAALKLLLPGLMFNGVSADTCKIHKR
ncbi:hypothetical protein AQUCO_01300819v1 [Aquilegia coerulea]|uniref:Uncharacterized protein n=1 Tax=Aquilegia coerulea TaxID=218851 RepID=A0A2G5E3K7_AQUCA|nr:hypothetical protein AQUCO_01300819v1 [Aquilegia coerulea]